MGLAQAEQKEVREREEGGSSRERWEPLPAGGRAAGRQAGGLAGVGARGCAGLRWLRWLRGQEYSGLLAGEEAAWKPPSLSLFGPPCLSTSSSFAVLSGPPRCLVRASRLCASFQRWAAHHPLSEAPAPPPLSPPVSGPLFLSTSPCLLYPRPKCPYLSVCQRGLSGWQQ